MQLIGWMPDFFGTLESTLHEQFASDRVSGEWFYWNDKMLDSFWLYDSSIDNKCLYQLHSAMSYERQKSINEQQTKEKEKQTELNKKYIEECLEKERIQRVESSISKIKEIQERIEPINIERTIIFLFKEKHYNPAQISQFIKSHGYNLPISRIMPIINKTY